MSGTLTQIPGPTGPEHGSLRRMPWVSISIMGLISLIYLYHNLAPGDLGPVIKAMNYRAARPYLTAPPILDQLIEGNASFILTTRRGKPKDPVRVRLEQEEMDLLAARGLAALEALPIRRWSYAPGDFEIVGLFSHIFYHQAMFHVALNFLFFALCGPFMEDRWGRVFFPCFFVAGGVASALAMTLQFPGATVLLYGASGAVAAVMGAYLVRYRHVKMRLMTSPSPWFPKALEISPMWIAPTWFIGEVLYMYLMRDVFGSGYIVVWSHVWGFVFGAIVALAIQRFDLESKLYADEYDQLPEELRLEWDIEKHLKFNELDEALKLLAEASAKFPEHESFLEQYWDQAFRMGRGAAAHAIVKKLIQRDLDRRGYDRAYFHWQGLIESAPGDNISLPLINRLAIGLLDETNRDSAKQVIGYTVDHLASGLAEETLLQFVETASFVDPGLALRALAVIIQKQPTDEFRQRLTHIEAELRLRFPNAEQEPQERSIEISRTLDPVEILEENPFAPTRIQNLKTHSGVPEALTDKGLRFRLKNGVRLLPFEKIKALSLGAIREIGAKPYLLIDILTDDPAEDLDQHGLLRLSSKDFDPRTLVPGSEKSSEALRDLIAKILAQSAAAALPDKATLIGEGFPKYKSVAEYEKKVYGVS